MALASDRLYQHHYHSHRPRLEAPHGVLMQSAGGASTPSTPPAASRSMPAARRSNSAGAAPTVVSSIMLAPPSLYTAHSPAASHHYYDGRPAGKSPAAAACICTASDLDTQPTPEWASPVQSFKTYLNQQMPLEAVDDGGGGSSSSSSSIKRAGGRKRSALASLFAIPGSDTVAQPAPKKKRRFPQPGAGVSGGATIAVQPRTVYAKCEKAPIDHTTVTTLTNFNDAYDHDDKDGYISFPAISDDDDEL